MKNFLRKIWRRIRLGKNWYSKWQEIYDSWNDFLIGFRSSDWAPTQVIDGLLNDFERILGEFREALEDYDEEGVVLAEARLCYIYGEILLQCAGPP